MKRRIKSNEEEKMEVARDMAHPSGNEPINLDRPEGWYQEPTLFDNVLDFFFWVIVAGFIIGCLS